jgi:ATP-dependent RNA helicase HelY
MTSAADGTDGSPASRYAASRRSVAEQRTPLASFREQYPFELDPFQVQACRAVLEGRGVLVAAPTGSGKTVIGELAVHLALTGGRKAFYTTPVKALSNQKYGDLVHRYGPSAVGLLTGDNTINGEAPVVVMTTEVLRNMLYADSSTLNGLGYVVMDEVHYLADRLRGAVWEEVIIHLPDNVQVISLSATVSNAEEFGDWLDTVRGDTEVVVSENRPVPLWQHVMVGTRLYDLFADETSGGSGRSAVGPVAKVNPELRRLARDGHRIDRMARGRGGHRNGGRGVGRGQRRAPARPEVISTLDAAGLLPAITFVFSRAGCDAAVAQCLAWGVRLTTTEERDEIRRIVDARCADIPDEDLAVLGFWEWVDALERGVAAHHAGLLPTFKEVVEELFSRGLVKAVFATETLALGVNMPARSVVLEKLVKWNGQSHADVTPGEYTQLTGRAGRRGIDVEGHGVVLWQPGLDPESVAGLASTRTYPLHSSFRPTYNMAVNLVGQVGRARAREILETSFAQFQADRAVVDLARQARRQEEALAGYARAMTCHLGDFAEYAALRRRISEREKELSRSGARDQRAETLARDDAPPPRRPRQRSAAADDDVLARLRAQLRSHPCHGCADREDHARWAERWWRLKRETDALVRRIEGRTNTIARVFDRVCDLLTEHGYLVGDTVTPQGRRLQRLYTESDLLVAECLRQGAWAGLDGPGTAACVSSLVYESRREEEGLELRVPASPVRTALHETIRIWSALEDRERAHRLEPTREPDLGLAWAIHRWASGHRLETILKDGDLAAGDFVRWCKQVVDLLGQVQQAAGDGPEGVALRRAADDAVNGVRRGVVAYSSVA